MDQVAEHHAASTPRERERALLLRLEIDEFNTRYATALDRGGLESWPDFFTESAVYKITSQENHDAGLPIGLIYCDSRGMFEDRIAAIKNTTVFSPRNIVHFITNIDVKSISLTDVIIAEAKFLLVENIIDCNPRLLMAGRYLDTFVRQADGRLLLEQRFCVYDTLTIQMSTIFPV